MNDFMTTAGLADRLGITVRRVQQLAELEVFARNPNGEFPVASNAARYQAYKDRDLDRICIEIARSAAELDDILERMRKAKSGDARRKIARSFGPCWENAWGWAATSVALLPEAQRDFVRSSLMTTAFGPAFAEAMKLLGVKGIVAAEEAAHAAPG